MTKRPPDSFTDQYLRGFVEGEDIDDYIDKWHEGGSGQTIYDFLGMTWDEYAHWVREGELPEITKGDH